MLSDLNHLMAERGIGAVIVPMHEAMHASFRWLTRGAKVTRGYAFKILDQEPFLVTYPMERGEAATSGLEIALVEEFGHEAIFRKAASAADGYSRFFDAVLRARGARGQVAFFGNAPVQLYLGLADSLMRLGWAVVRSNGEDLIQLARKRKETHEIDLIASVGRRTVEVVEEVRAALRDCTPAGRLTIGDLKAIVRDGITRRGMIEDHDTILSAGRDAGVPHSRGNPADVVRPGVPIVLDIFPLDRESGYFFDLTRTFCIGDPPIELKTLHRHVREAFDVAAQEMRPGTPARSWQARVCDIFEAQGYRTTRSHPGTLDGYVHSLGHGVGLEIHEKPSFSLTSQNTDLIEENDVLTIEPGLYFPDRGVGVRIEDTFHVTQTGVRSLCPGGYDLDP